MTPTPQAMVECLAGIKGRDNIRPVQIHDGDGKYRLGCLAYAHPILGMFAYVKDEPEPGLTIIESSELKGLKGDDLLLKLLLLLDREFQRGQTEVSYD